MDEKEIQDDVELMNKSFDEDLVEASPEPEPEPETEEPKIEVLPDVEEPLDKGEPIEKEPDEEPAAEEAPPVEEPEEEPDERDKIITDLRQKLADKEEAITPKPEPEPEPKPEPLTLEEQDFLGDLDINEILGDPREFNKLLNKVLHQGVDTSRKVLGEGILRAIPDIVKANVTTIAELQKASDDFYKANEDLRPFHNVVAAVFEDLASDSPGKGYDEILPDVGKEVRNRLELHLKATTKKEDKPSPRLPRNKGRSTQPKDKPSIDPLMKELEDMNESLRGY